MWFYNIQDLYSLSNYESQWKNTSEPMIITYLWRKKGSLGNIDQVVEISHSPILSIMNNLYTKRTLVVASIYWNKDGQREIFIYSLSKKIFAQKKKFKMWSSFQDSNRFFFQINLLLFCYSQEFVIFTFQANVWNGEKNFYFPSITLRMLISSWPNVSAL